MFFLVLLKQPSEHETPNYFLCYRLLRHLHTQLPTNIRHALSSSKLYTDMRKFKLSDKPLPLTISICIKPGLNQTELLSAGYEIDTFFTYGISHHNSTLARWGGRK